MSLCIALRTHSSLPQSQLPFATSGCGTWNTDCCYLHKSNDISNFANEFIVIMSLHEPPIHTSKDTHSKMKTFGVMPYSPTWLQLSASPCARWFATKCQKASTVAGERSEYGERTQHRHHHRIRKGCGSKRMHIMISVISEDLDRQTMYIWWGHMQLAVQESSHFDGHAIQ